jgi:hypothetical protein
LANASDGLVGNMEPVAQDESMLEELLAQVSDLKRMNRYVSVSQSAAMGDDVLSVQREAETLAEEITDQLSSSKLGALKDLAQREVVAQQQVLTFNGGELQKIGATPLALLGNNTWASNSIGKGEGLERQWSNQGDLEASASTALNDNVQIENGWLDRPVVEPRVSPDRSTLSPIKPAAPAPAITLSLNNARANRQQAPGVVRPVDQPESLAPAQPNATSNAELPQLRITGRRALKIHLEPGAGALHFRKLQDHATLDLVLERQSPPRWPQAMFLLALGLWGAAVSWQKRRGRAERPQESRHHAPS